MSTSEKPSAGGAFAPGPVQSTSLPSLNEKGSLSTPTPSVRKTLLTLPLSVRKIIFAHVFTVQGGRFFGVTRGLICLADQPGYPPKICDLAILHKGLQHNDDYLTEKSEEFAPFVRREVPTWHLEVNRLKYVCRQLYHETRGCVLRVNEGRKILFHSTRVKTNPLGPFPAQRYHGASSGTESFVDFWNGCSLALRRCIRDVEIIQLTAKNERLQGDLGRGFGVVPTREEFATVATRSLIQHLLAFEFKKAFFSTPPTPVQFEKIVFQRQCAELTGQGNAVSRRLYEICRQTPLLRVVVRFNELEDCLGANWIHLLCTYRFALRGDVGDIWLTDDEAASVRNVAISKGAGRGGNERALENLRMSSTVNYGVAGSHPKGYFWAAQNDRALWGRSRERLRHAELLFYEGV